MSAWEYPHSRLEVGIGLTRIMAWYDGREDSFPGESIALGYVLGDVPHDDPCEMHEHHAGNVLGDGVSWRLMVAWSWAVAYRIAVDGVGALGLPPAEEELAIPPTDQEVQRAVSWGDVTW